MLYNKVLLFSALLYSTQFTQAQEATVKSPSGNISITVHYGNVLTYRVTMDGKAVLSDSPLGFQFKNEPDMGTDLALLSQKENEITNSWIPVVKSRHAKVLDHYKELKLCFVEKTGLRRKIDMEFRAYDNGVAFRYQLYRSEVIGNRLITKELTGYNLAANDPKAWVADYGGYTSSHESEFWPKQLSSVSDSTKVALPLLVELDKQTYAAITEAKIDNYPGFFIGAKGNHLFTKLAPLPLEKEDGVKERFHDQLYTPWRVILLGKTPGSLIESEIIQNLNDPCAINDPSWIKPGISAWDHWWSGDIKVDMPTIKSYIDFAAKQGWPYMLIDAEWYGKYDTPESDITKTARQVDMPELLRYAKSKNVRLWVWMTNGDANRNGIYKNAFALYQQWGLAGVKIDFVNREDQDAVNWYHDILKCAAEHHLMVDFHGAYKPDGITRTFPNMMTREGVMGNEYNKWAWSNRETPEHTTTLPFTRMLAGQMDFTPGGFVNVTAAKHERHDTPTTSVMATRCGELAKFVIYESPITIECDAPQNVLGQPGADFLKIVPTTWDDGQVLSGYPGEHIVMVKQNGNRYFIGAMNNSTPRTVTVNLSFLPAGKYKMTSWADADDASVNPTKLVKREEIVSRADGLTIKMAIGGGYVAVLEKIN